MIQKILKIGAYRNLGRFIPTWKRKEKTDTPETYALHNLDLPFYVNITLTKQQIESIKDGDTAWIESNTIQWPITISFTEKKEIII